MQEGYGSNGVGNSNSVNWITRGGVGSASGLQPTTVSGQQVNYGLRGGVITHSEGILFLSNRWSESMCIISAPGAAAARDQHNGGVEVDWI